MNCNLVTIVHSLFIGKIVIAMVGPRKWVSISANQSVYDIIGLRSQCLHSNILNIYCYGWNLAIKLKAVTSLGCSLTLTFMTLNYVTYLLLLLNVVVLCDLTSR